MSVMVRKTIEKNLEVVRKLIDAKPDAPKNPATIKGKIRKLEDKIKNESDPDVIESYQDKIVKWQKEIARLEKPSKSKPVPPTQYVSELKSLADGYTKILAVMQNIPFYMTSTKGRKPAWMAKTTPVKKTRSKKAQNRRPSA